MADEDPRLDPKVWQAWKDAEPPVGFADRVMETKRYPIPPRRSPLGRRLLLGGIVAVAAAVAIMALRGREPRSLEGERAVAARSKIELGSRGVAVAEAGSRLAWRIDRSSTVVSQPEGDVFYRVDRGRAFVVETPFGSVSVTGTCFRVALEDRMKKIVGSGVAGAALGAALVVTVYEGSVRVENAKGAVDVPAGEAARVEGDRAPALVPGAAGPAALAGDPSPSASRDELLLRDRAQRDEIAALKLRLARAEGDGKVVVKRGGPGGEDHDRTMFEPTQEDLVAMAKRCEVAIALPPFGAEPGQLGPAEAQRLGLSPEEARRVNEVITRQNAEFIKAIRALYLEATGDAAGADQLDVGAMIMELERKSADTDAIRQKIAEERAGLRPAPADPRGGTPFERYLRLALAAGPAFERALAPILGAERVRQHRDELFGRRMIQNGCPEGR